MAEMKEAILAEVVKHFDVPGFVGGVLDGAVNEALTKMVQDTSTPFDDVAKNALYPVLVAEIKKVVEAQWAKLAQPKAA